MKKELILQELKSIKADLRYIKTHIQDRDLILAKEDVESIREAKKEIQEKKTKRLI